jgi:hypothetical protein
MVKIPQLAVASTTYVVNWYSESLLVPLVFGTWNNLIPWLGKLAELQYLIEIPS